MTSQEFADRTARLASLAQDRILTVGHDQYALKSDTQRFEFYSLEELRRELADELADGVAYLTMVQIKADNIIRELQRREAA